jgi:uncharacterized membrane protein YjfL (UPF0719 family)
MKKSSKRIMKWSAVAVAIFLIGYGSYRLYNYAIEVAIERIKKGVAKGVSKGISDVINPLKWFGRKHKKGSD